MLNQKTAARYYEQAQREGTLLENLPLESLRPFLDKATPGFNEAVIKAWEKDLQPWENAQDKHDEYQLEQGLAALHPGATRDDVILIFRTGSQEGAECHMIGMPFAALDGVVQRQHAVLKRRAGPRIEIDNKKERELIDEMLDATERTGILIEAFQFKEPAAAFSANVDSALVRAAQEYLDHDSVTAARAEIAEAQHTPHKNIDGTLKLPPPSFN